MNNLHAITVCVNYHDCLSLSLPYNRHHFRHYTIVTSHDDYRNVAPIAEANNAQVLATDLFTYAGALFNKWLALEWGLSQIGRKGWLCLLDADVLWPKDAPLDRILRPGFLYSPLRRMYPTIPKSAAEIPSEEVWNRYSIHHNLREHAGYSQIFHADDPVLGSPPWHDTRWLTAGSADSFFQAKWPDDKKIRPTWYVLHLGEPGQNWCGRATAYADGSVPPDAQSRRDRVRQLWIDRRGKRGMEAFKDERYSDDVDVPNI